MLVLLYWMEEYRYHCLRTKREKLTNNKTGEVKRKKDDVKESY